MNAFEANIGEDATVTTLFISGLGKQELENHHKLNEETLEKLNKPGCKILSVGVTYKINGKEFYTNFALQQLNSVLNKWKEENEVVR